MLPSGMFIKLIALTPPVNVFGMIAAQLPPMPSTVGYRTGLVQIVPSLRMPPVLLFSVKVQYNGRPVPPTLSYNATIFSSPTSEVPNNAVPPVGSPGVAVKSSKRTVEVVR